MLRIILINEKQSSFGLLHLILFELQLDVDKAWPLR